MSHFINYLLNCVVPLLANLHTVKIGIGRTGLVMMKAVLCKFLHSLILNFKNFFLTSGISKTYFQFGTWINIYMYIDGLALDCNNSIAGTLEILQPCAKP